MLYANLRNDPLSHIAPTLVINYYERLIYQDDIALVL